MNTILRKHILAGYCLVYLDDVVIQSQSISEHAVHLDQVLSSLKQHNLFCQMPKCTWAQSQFKYLGHIVTGQGVEPDPAKLKALVHWEPPLQLVAQLAALDLSVSSKEATVLKERVATECRRYLGFMNYFNRFIPRYSDLACDLHKHTQKSPPEWTPECTEAWNKLKACLLKATMMYHPVFSLPFHVYSDASSKAVGGVLIQFQDGVAHPVAYVARKLTSAEVNYTTTEQEMLAFVYCFQQWRCYLEGSQVLLHTDHEPLTWLATQDRPNRRQARWLEFLAGFRYDILYVKGDQNVVADALSRMLSPPPESPLRMPGDDWPVVSQMELCTAPAWVSPPKIQVDVRQQLRLQADILHKQAIQLSCRIQTAQAEATTARRRSTQARQILLGLEESYLRLQVQQSEAASALQAHCTASSSLAALPAAPPIATEPEVPPSRQGVETPSEWPKNDYAQTVCGLPRAR
jgi:hypothetical protein